MSIIITAILCETPKVVNCCHVGVACCSEVQAAAILRSASSLPPEVSLLRQGSSAVNIAELQYYFNDLCVQPAVG